MKLVSVFSSMKLLITALCVIMTILTSQSSAQTDTNSTSNSTSISIFTFNSTSISTSNSTSISISSPTSTSTSTSTSTTSPSTTTKIAILNSSVSWNTTGKGMSVHTGVSPDVLLAQLAVILIVVMSAT